MKKLVVVLLLLVFAGSAAAQDQPLDPNATPDHGIAAGGVGFQPDPFRVDQVAGGGAINAQQRNLGDDCVGLVNVQPTFRFKALTAFDRLRFIFVSEAVAWDASLIVRAPDGNYYCNNDSYGLNNPTVEIDAAAPGDYNVWVGALTDRAIGNLYLTTRSDVVPGSTGLIVPRPTPDVTPAPTATPIPATALNPTLPPIYGAERLEAGFLPDPYYRVVSAGGALNVTNSVSGDGCYGFASGAPDFRVDWSGDSTRLRFLFAPLDDDLDAALIVQSPGGWGCNRDFAPGYSRPQVEFINPAMGSYNVWVSSETAPNPPIVGVLYVTEKQYSPETVPAGGTPPTDPVGGLTPGTSDFSFNSGVPDPYAIPGSVGGGELDAGSQNKDCPGFYPAIPSFAFTLAQATAHLRVFFVSDDPLGDAALIVRMPDGEWYCNDDTYRSKQPMVDVIGNFTPGAVSVWIGSFNAGDTIPGTLYLTRGSASPLDPTRPAPLNLAN